ncbi:MAG: 23S rRNA (pseudouridine(1915)-N(3))-methyltransferase RlmH [Ruminococcus sp.]|nr:23S rRNA (pseudouridine(1915)-N(3))-methyltransferase RlmH [Ruminococcus sp.]
MIRINLVTVGKLKEKYWRDAAAEYQKRLSAFCQLNIVELNEYKLSDSPSQKEIEAALASEGKDMEKYLSIGSSCSIAMCVEGGQLTSEELSEKLDSYGTQGISTVNFLIGSSFGLSEAVKSRCALRLSMSKLTFPHQLARIMLLEQIYRSFQISHNTRYHK